MFDENELELLISGLPSIDLNDLEVRSWQTWVVLPFARDLLNVARVGYVRAVRGVGRCARPTRQLSGALLLPASAILDQAHTVYNGYQRNSKNIRWFWRALRELSEQDRAKLLQFATGTSKASC